MSLLRHCNRIEFIALFCKKKKNSIARESSAEWKHKNDVRLSNHVTPSRRSCFSRGTVLSLRHSCIQRIPSTLDDIKIMFDTWK